MRSLTHVVPVIVAQGLTPTASGSLIVGSEEALGRLGPGGAMRRGDSFALSDEQLVCPPDFVINAPSLAKALATIRMDTYAAHPAYLLFAFLAAKPFLALSRGVYQLRAATLEMLFNFPLHTCSKVRTRKGR